MARNSPLISLLNELRTAPWWVSVLIGVALFVGIGEVLPMFIDESRLTEQLTQMFRWVGALFLVPAGISAYRLLVGRQLVATTRTKHDIRAMDWRTFEDLIEAYYREHGFRVERQLESGADGGVDVRIRNQQGERYLIQCKHWKSQKVGVKIVRELLGVVAAEGAKGGIVIISGEFTNEARTFAKGVAIELIDGDHLARMLRDQIDGQQSTGSHGTVQKASQKSCPRCGSDLVLRKANRGPNAGNSFYGCSTYPRCRYTRNLES